MFELLNEFPLPITRVSPKHSRNSPYLSTCAELLYNFATEHTETTETFRKGFLSVLCDLCGTLKYQSNFVHLLI